MRVGTFYITKTKKSRFGLKSGRRVWSLSRAAGEVMRRVLDPLSRVAGEGGARRVSDGKVRAPTRGAVREALTRRTLRVRRPLPRGGRGNETRLEFLSRAAGEVKTWRHLAATAMAFSSMATAVIPSGDEPLWLGRLDHRYKPV
jgi:hypothetical protein